MVRPSFLSVYFIRGRLTPFLNHTVGDAALDKTLALDVST